MPLHREKQSSHYHVFTLLHLHTTSSKPGSQRKVINLRKNLRTLVFRVTDAVREWTEPLAKSEIYKEQVATKWLRKTTARLRLPVNKAQ